MLHIVRVLLISMFSSVLYCFIIYLGHCFAKKTTYEGAQVWRTDLRNPIDVKAFQKLADIGVISPWNLKGYVADYLVQAEDQKKVKLALETGALEQTVLISDVQKVIDDMKEPTPQWNVTTLRIGHRLTWKSYPRLNVINEYLNFLVKSYPDLCSISTIGYSVENRPIKMLRISNKYPKNKVIMITAGIHAREWITITSALYLMHHIVSNFTKLPNYVKFTEWKIIPVVNPDGYEYSHTHDRLWRKNRRKLSTSSECAGVDLNRNFGHKWYIEGVTKNCCICSDQYPGTHEFSEPETLAIRDYVLRDSMPNAFVDIHSYGQVILFPWGHTPEPPDNGALLSAVAKKMSKAIKLATGREYFTGDTFHTMYQTAGIQMDWFLSQGVGLSYTIEMTADGFIQPPKLIEPIAQDLVAAMKKLAKTMGEMMTKKKPIDRGDIILGLSLNWA